MMMMMMTTNDHDDDKGNIKGGGILAKSNEAKANCQQWPDNKLCIQIRFGFIS